MVVRIRRGFLKNDHLFICDPKALQHMFVKDPGTFDQGSTQQETTRLIHGPGLLSSTGEQHKRQRRLLNPVFAAGNLRRLVPVFFQVSHQLAEELDRNAKRGAEVDVLGHMSRTALEMIGQGGLGHSFAAEGPYSLSVTLKDLLPSVFQFVHYWPLLRCARTLFGPRVLRLAAVRLAQFSAPAARLLHNVDTLDDATRTIFERKKIAVVHGRATSGSGGGADGGAGVDIVSQLLLANARAPPSERHPDDELRAHMTTLITAGRDTVSHVLSRTLAVLAERPDVQEALRAEVFSAAGREDAVVGMDTLNGMRYLDAVIREMLRLYSTISFVNRNVQHDTALPLSSGEVLAVPQGTTIRVGIATANTAPALWGADAHEFKPERWLVEQKESGAHAGDTVLPGVWAGIMSFMGGPRACIGYKFALLELKVLLVVLLRRFRFGPGARVEWYLGPSNTPYIVGREGEGPKLPLLVQPLDDSKE
ncbi:cytochrome P450 [Auricularia subglabra TFB-10046 SS5]|nr:cytochrome P450 [Auricularia subglabra TFB-10046 SS5]